jgi:predicted DNA-binding transcriptional regulator AlpA
MSDEQRPRKMIDIDGVLELIPTSESSIDRMVRAGEFPAPTYIGRNRKAWFEDELLAWQNALQDSNPFFNSNRGRGRRSGITIIKGGAKPSSAGD